MTYAMNRGGGRGQKFLMDRSKKLPTWGKGVCVCACACYISGKNFKRLLWTVPSFNQKFEDFFFSTSWLLLNSGTLNYSLFIIWGFFRELQDNRDLIHTDLEQNKHNNHFGVCTYYVHKKASSHMSGRNIWTFFEAPQQYICRNNPQWGKWLS